MTDPEGSFTDQWDDAQKELANTDNADKVWSYIEKGTQSCYSLDDFEYKDIKAIMNKLEEYNLVVDW